MANCESMTNCELTWDSHYSSLLSFLDLYLRNEKLADVTLAADGKVMHVHRLVLLAASSYFEVIQFNFIQFILPWSLLLLTYCWHTDMLLLFLLQEMLSLSNEKQAVIYFKDVSFANLEYLVQVRIVFTLFYWHNYMIIDNYIFVSFEVYL